MYEQPVDQTRELPETNPDQPENESSGGALNVEVHHLEGGLRLETAIYKDRETGEAVWLENMYYPDNGEPCWDRGYVLSADGRPVLDEKAGVFVQAGRLRKRVEARIDPQTDNCTKFITECNGNGQPISEEVDYPDPSSGSNVRARQIKYHVAGLEAPVETRELYTADPDSSEVVGPQLATR